MAVGDALVLQIKRKYGSLLESVAVAIHVMVEPIFVGVVVAEAALSRASCPEFQVGGVFRTVIEVVTSSALTVSTLNWKKA